MIAPEKLEVLTPRSMRQALALLQDEAPLMPLAGGTDIFVALHLGVLQQRRFLDLSRLESLRRIEREGRGRKAWLVVGACATYSDCIRSRAVRDHLSILVEAASQVGSVQVQNRGTLGGNIGNGSPAGDALPVLAAADARVVLASRAGEREVRLDEYFTGYRASVRRHDELIVAIRVPPVEGVQYFRKVGARAAQAISKVVLARVGGAIALGSVAATVVRARHVETYWSGGGRDLAEAQRLLDEDIAPIDDLRSSSAYRRRVAANLLAEALRCKDDKLRIVTAR